MALSGKTKLAGVMGWPISHSRSPQLHGHWLDTHGIDGAYVPLAVAPAHFDAAFRALPKLGFAGVNITIPHKEAALAAVDTATPLARRLGAVNTVVIAKDGTTVGDNTDGFGFIENLRQSQPDVMVTTGPAVVIGAGGSARAIVAALLNNGISTVRLINRTRDRAAALAAGLGGAVEVVDFADRAAALADAALLVNTTSQGMVGQPALDLTLDHLPRTAVVTDIVYTPLETPLLAAARARGNRAVDGLGMLLHQARPGFAAWFGTEPAVTDALRRAVLA